MMEENNVIIWCNKGCHEDSYVFLVDNGGERVLGLRKSKDAFHHELIRLLFRDVSEFFPAKPYLYFCFHENNWLDRDWNELEKIAAANRKLSGVRALIYKNGPFPKKPVPFMPVTSYFNAMQRLADAGPEFIPDNLFENGLFLSDEKCDMCHWPIVMDTESCSCLFADFKTRYCERRGDLSKTPTLLLNPPMIPENGVAKDACLYLFSNVSISDGGDHMYLPAWFLKCDEGENAGGVFGIHADVNIPFNWNLNEGQGACAFAKDRVLWHARRIAPNANLKIIVEDVLDPFQRSFYNKDIDIRFANGISGTAYFDLVGDCLWRSKYPYEIQILNNNARYFFSRNYGWW